MPVCVAWMAWLSTLKTVCSAYSGLVPMSPKTTPSAASVTATRPTGAWAPPRSPDSASSARRPGVLAAGAAVRADCVTPAGYPAPRFTATVGGYRRTVRRASGGEMGRCKGFWSQRPGRGSEDAHLLAAERVHALRQLSYEELRAAAGTGAEIEEARGRDGGALRAPHLRPAPVAGRPPRAANPRLG